MFALQEPTKASFADVDVLSSPSKSPTRTTQTQKSNTNDIKQPLLAGSASPNKNKLRGQIQSPTRADSKDSEHYLSLSLETEASDTNTNADSAPQVTPQLTLHVDGPYGQPINPQDYAVGLFSVLCCMCYVLCSMFSLVCFLFMCCCLVFVVWCAAVLVAGGVGVTPFISVLKDLHNRSKLGGEAGLSMLKHVIFVWVVGFLFCLFVCSTLGFVFLLLMFVCSFPACVR